MTKAYKWQTEKLQQTEHNVQLTLKGIKTENNTYDTKQDKTDSPNGTTNK